MLFCTRAFECIGVTVGMVGGLVFGRFGLRARDVEGRWVPSPPFRFGGSEVLPIAWELGG